MNRVVLIGRLTKEPELRKTNNGNSVIRFTLAVNRRYKKDNEQEADFVTCIAWNKIAENMATYLGKGSLVGVDGRIQTGSYDDKNGNRVYKTEIVAENVEFLESRNNNQQSKPNNNANDVNNYFGEFNIDDKSDLDNLSEELPF